MKKPTKFILLLISTLATTLVYSQTTEIQGTIDFGDKATVYKLITIPNCPQTHNPPDGTSSTTMIHQTKFTNGKTEIVVVDTIRPTGNAPYTINANKELKISIAPNSSGKANLYLNDKDKSVLYVNYWLNNKNSVPKDTHIEEWYPSYDCAGTPTMTQRLTVKRKLINEESFDGVKVSPADATTMGTTWFKNSEHLRVLKSNGSIDYYIVNRYDRVGKYILELMNREFIYYKSQSLDLGALTIPFKYRFGYKEDEIKVKDDVAAGINIGVYGGYKLSRYSIINKSGTYTHRLHASFRVGPFLSLSSTTLDSLTTTAGEIPMKKDEKQNIALLSTGLGVMLDIKGVQFGLYGGWDFGMGSEAKNWNYNRKFWLGFGVGYKITDLFLKKE